MNLEDLRSIAARGESETIEFKRSTAEVNTAARTLCAMLNGQRGGMVLFGVGNNGAIVGQDIGEQTHDRIRAEVRKIDPPVIPELRTIPLSGDSAVLVATVSGGTGLFRHDGKAYERFGPTTSVMSEAENQRRLLEHLHSITRWENQTSPLSIADLDPNEVSITIDEAIRVGRLSDPGSREIEAMLNGLQLLKEDQLLHAATVLFGRADRMLATYPQCGLRLARFRGVDKVEFVDSRQLFGNAFYLYQQAQQFFIEHVPVAGKVEGFLRTDTPRYPTAAFREALVNALCHRDYAEASGSIDIAIYDNRLEVVSTGGLRFGLTVEQLKTDHQSRPWNPLVAQAFYLRGIIEKWGRGTTRMTDIARDAGLGDPEFVDSRIAFTVRFRAGRLHEAPKLPLGLSAIQQETLVALHTLTVAPLHLIHGELEHKYSVDQVRKALYALRDRELVILEGRTRSGQWRISTSISLG